MNWKLSHPTWQMVRIADVAAKRRHALVIGPFGSDLKTSDYRDDGVPIVFVRDVQPNCFDPQQRRFVSEAKARALAAHAVIPGDLVITKMGAPPCVAAVYPATEATGIVTADIIKLSVDEARADRNYVARFLNTDFARSQIAGITFGITRPKVTLRDFKEIQIPLPPLPEQRRIAEVLERAEGLRTKRRAALAQLDELTQAIFLDMFGDPATNPKGWQVVPLGELAQIVRGASPRPKGDPRYFGGPIPWLMISDVTSEPGKVVTRTKEGVTEAGRDKSVYLKPGTLVLTNSATVGVPKVLGVAACIHDGFLAFLNIDPRIERDFLYMFFFLMRAHLARLAPEGTQKNLNTGIAKALPMIVPPLELQHEFARRVAAVEKLKAAHRASLAEMDALFASMQHRAFRGEL